MTMIVLKDRYNQIVRTEITCKSRPGESGPGAGGGLPLATNVFAHLQHFQGLSFVKFVLLVVSRSIKCSSRHLYFLLSLIHSHFLTPLTLFSSFEG